MPLVRLTIFEWGLRLGPSTGALKMFIPTIEIRYGEIDYAGAAKGPIFRSPSVRIIANAPDIAALFWTSDPNPVLDVLAKHGVPVGWKPITLTNERWTQP
jgi:hypothetical protein